MDDTLSCRLCGRSTQCRDDRLAGFRRRATAPRARARREVDRRAPLRVLGVGTGAALQQELHAAQLALHGGDVERGLAAFVGLVEARAVLEAQLHAFDELLV